MDIQKKSQSIDGAVPEQPIEASKQKKIREVFKEETDGEKNISSDFEVKSQNKSKKRFWKDWSKKQKIIFVVVLSVIAVLIAGFLVFWFVFDGKSMFLKDKGKEEVAVVEEIKSPENMSPLTGEYFDPVPAKRTPMAIVVENLSTVRPQPGLGSADVVYEFLAEGGITRFLTIFASRDVLDPYKIGPVRSLRSYFIPPSYNIGAPVYHVGGAPNALEIASAWSIRDVNQFFGPQYFWRDHSLSAPHNVFTRTDLTQYAVRDHGWPLDDGRNIKEWKFVDEAAKENRGDTSTIYCPFSAGNYNVKWEYDKENNKYLRFHVDTPHLDGNNDEQIAVKNVVVEYVTSGRIEGDDKGRLEIKNVEGEGKALVFNNGKVIEGIWKKASKDERERIYDSSGKEVEFARGQFWIEMMPVEKKVTWE